jgi:hypothetical protein
MDKKLEEALEFSNYRLTINNQKQNLKLRMHTMCVVGFANSIFSATTELISFVKLIIDSGNTQYVFLDSNENPVLVTELPEFYSRILGAYTSAINEYYTELVKLNQVRSVAEIVG